MLYQCDQAFTIGLTFNLVHYGMSTVTFSTLGTSKVVTGEIRSNLKQLLSYYNGKMTELL